MSKFAALIAYEGTRYCGWQIQKGASGTRPSIQGIIREKLFEMTGEAVSVVGSGRTDSGVHATGQVAHFSLESDRWNERNLYLGMNSLLPQSIRWREVKQVDEAFHAQRRAIRKQYSYYFQQGSVDLPHMRPYSRWIRKPLDVEAMKTALQAFQGEHDFKAFCASGSPVKTTVRNIMEAEILIRPVPFPLSEVGQASLVQVRLVGNGFLKQMVRGIAGTLLEVGEGRRSAQSIPELIKAGIRSEIGATAPSRGLWLDRVWYEHLQWEAYSENPSAR